MNNRILIGIAVGVVVIGRIGVVNIITSEKEDGALQFRF